MKIYLSIRDPSEGCGGVVPRSIINESNDLRHMNDDTFSRNEAYMVQFHRSRDRVASRESASGFANVVGARLANDAMSESRSALASNAVNASVAYLENEIAHRDRYIAELERDLADLRGALPADPAGAHPYRSTATKAPSRPVAASDRAERVEGRPGAWRRVYGALASRRDSAWFSLVAPLAGFAAFLMCSSAGSDAAGLGVGAIIAGGGTFAMFGWCRA